MDSPFGRTLGANLRFRIGGRNQGCFFGRLVDGRKRRYMIPIAGEFFSDPLSKMVARNQIFVYSF